MVFHECALVRKLLHYLSKFCTDVYQYTEIVPSVCIDANTLHGCALMHENFALVRTGATSFATLVHQCKHFSNALNLFIDEHRCMKVSH